MELIDISQALEPGMVKYQSLNDFSVAWLRHYSLGSPMALSAISMPSHLGTHIDAPFHFIENGKKTDGIGLEKLCGEAQLIDGRGRMFLDKDFFETVTISVPRALIKTDNTEQLKDGADFDNVYLTSDACECLAGIGVVLVGFDFLALTSGAISPALPTCRFCPGKWLFLKALCWIQSSRGSMSFSVSPSR
jgi:arylformamidase